MQLAIKKNRELFFILSFLLVLAVIENSLPRFVPFFRLGLVNMALLYGIERLKWSSFFLLVLLKVLCLSFLGGTLFSPLAIMSLCGSVLSAQVMWLLYKVARPYISFVAISATSAVCHAATQLFVASYLGFAKEIFYLMPILLTASFVSGVVVGLLYSSINLESFYATFLETLNGNNTDLSVKKQSRFEQFSFYGLLIINLLAILFFSIICSPSLLVGLTILLLVILCCLQPSSLKLIPRYGITFLVLLLLNNLSPRGEVIFKLGFLTIGKSSFFIGLKKAAYFTGIILLSKISILSLKEFGLYLAYFEFINKVGKELVGKFHKLIWHYVGTREKKAKEVNYTQRVECKDGLIASSKRKLTILFLLNLFIFLLVFIGKFAETRIELGCTL